MRGRSVAVLAVSGALVAGYVAADAADVLPDPVPGLLTLEPPWEEPAPYPTVALDPPAVAPPVLTDLDPAAPLPDADGLAALTADLVRDPRLGQGAGAVVLDAATGRVVANEGGGQALIPASTVKLLTTTAALITLGEDARLSTRVLMDVSDGAATPATLYLRGGGDVLLAAGAGDDAVVGHGGLGDLAADVARELAARDVSLVRLRLDDTILEGPATAPGWGAIDLRGGFVAPVAALAVDRGIVEGRIEREQDPALAAAWAFSAALVDQGVAVEGAVERAQAPDGATELGVVESATVGELVAHALRESDNDVAEVLARLVADARGEPASFSGVSTAVPDSLADLGLDTAGVTVVDGSGLSEGNRVPPFLLARLAALMADPDYPDLLPAANGLPVAGLDGTLSGRFAGGSDSAAGVLRAKTGTLVTVVSLAGLVPDSDGRLLAFAVVADDVLLGGVAAAREAVDAWAGSLAEVGALPAG